MLTPSVYKRQLFKQSLTFIKHHQKHIEACLILALIALMYGAAVHVKAFRFADIGRETEMSRIISGTVGPLTRLTEPISTREYALREAYIMHTLERLLQTSHVERTYAVVYEYAGPTVTRDIEAQVLEIFEVRQDQIAPRFENIQGMSRRQWLQIQQDEQMLTQHALNIFQSYGFELQNERGIAIGYVGFERNRGQAPFQYGEIAQLRETATAVTQGLLQSLDELEQPSL